MARIVVRSTDRTCRTGGGLSVRLRHADRTIDAVTRTGHVLIPTGGTRGTCGRTRIASKRTEIARGTIRLAGQRLRRSDRTLRASDGAIRVRSGTSLTRRADTRRQSARIVTERAQLTRCRTLDRLILAELARQTAGVAGRILKCSGTALDADRSTVTVAEGTEWTSRTVGARELTRECTETA